jgi:DNA-directed RNA polymerase subunit RPC12/RpoP
MARLPVSPLALCACLPYVPDDGNTSRERAFRDLLHAGGGSRWRQPDFVLALRVAVWRRATSRIDALLQAATFEAAVLGAAADYAVQCMDWVNARALVVALEASGAPEARALADACLRRVQAYDAVPAVLHLAEPPEDVRRVHDALLALQGMPGVDPTSKDALHGLVYMLEDVAGRDSGLLARGPAWEEAQRSEIAPCLVCMSRPSGSRAYLCCPWLRREPQQRQPQGSAARYGGQQQQVWTDELLEPVLQPVVGDVHVVDDADGEDLMMAAADDGSSPAALGESHQFSAAETVLPATRKHDTDHVVCLPCSYHMQELDVTRRCPACATRTLVRVRVRQPAEPAATAAAVVGDAESWTADGGAGAGAI